MIFTIIVVAITCLTMILSVLFFPKMKIGKLKIDSYWVIVLVGALILLFSGEANYITVGQALVADNAINPLKILVLFISMTLLSVFLDELGFFRFIANETLKRAKTSQIKLFVYLYLIVSILTVFTSNDVIILSFTPFICYFAKNAKISPVPYLAGEFVAANTWSMALIIGNPTNIYLSTAFGVNFIEYLKVMILPTLAAGVIALCCLYLMFHKKLKEPILGEAEDVVIKDKLLLWVGISHLAVCTVFLAIGSFISVEMWLVSLCAVISLVLFNVVIAIIRKQKPIELFRSFKRAPWQLIPFVLSMFIMILALQSKGFTDIINNFLGEKYPVFSYGLSSFVVANLINNIPMSVLYSAIITPAGGVVQTMELFSTIIGSNIGAFLTPIGALAGIMWTSIIGSHDIKFGYLDFLKLGVFVAVPTILGSLLVLNIII